MEENIHKKKTIEWMNENVFFILWNLYFYFVMTTCITTAHLFIYFIYFTVIMQVSLHIFYLF